MPPTVVPAVPEIRRRDDGRDQVELRVDDARVSSCTLQAFTVRVGAARVPMAGLGNVETLEAHRMRGYSRRVLDAAMQQMLRGPAVVSMLYGIDDMYHRFGYVPVGAMHTVTLTDVASAQSLPPNWTWRTWRAADQGDVGRIVDLARTMGGPDAVGPAVRSEGGKVLGRLRAAVEGRTPDDVCLVLEDASGSLAGYAWRACGFWKVDEIIAAESNALVMGEVVARDAAAASALLAGLCQSAREANAARVVCAVPPSDPLWDAARGCEAQLMTATKRNGGSMGVVLDPVGLVRALAPEFERRASGRTVRVAQVSGDAGRAPHTITLDIDGDHVTLANGTLAQLTFGYRHPSNPQLAALFPRRHQFMAQPDRF